MTLLVIMIGMIATTAAALLHPLLRKQPTAPQRVDFDMLVYRDQVAEVDRDVERGLLDHKQSEAARTEIYRRALAAEDAGKSASQPRATSKFSRILPVLLILIILPVGSMMVYIYLGSPELPGKPYAERLKDPDFAEAVKAERMAEQMMTMNPDDQMAAIHGMVDRLAARLKDSPDDLEGWKKLAKAYRVLGEGDKAAAAESRVEALQGKR